MGLVGKHNQLSVLHQLVCELGRICGQQRVYGLHGDKGGVRSTQTMQDRELPGSRVHPSSACQRQGDALEPGQAGASTTVGASKAAGRGWFPPPCGQRLLSGLQGCTG